ncbi:MAG TPA: endonuclease domain-containing protein [Candidatus Cloacimonadota bacterium]|nr:endonuclease domain-containing protein [Candidatus Cloacimonadota bacterium]HPT71612.1 endonuclease domain-containing protein [Candidatus Cloacimonadota bacterium]
MNKYQFPHSKNSYKYARQNRKINNPYERCFWKLILTNANITKYKWTRQKPIENYILDFYCPKLRMAIEIDGQSHDDTKFYDELRTKLLNEYNIQVVRYKNEDIKYNIEYVADDLIERIKDREKKLASNISHLGDV